MNEQMKKKNLWKSILSSLKYGRNQLNHYKRLQMGVCSLCKTSFMERYLTIKKNDADKRSKVDGSQENYAK